MNKIAIKNVNHLLIRGGGRLESLLTYINKGIIDSLFCIIEKRYYNE